MTLGRLVGNGGVEISLACLVSALVVGVAFLGRIPPLALLVDLSAFVSVVLAQRWLRLGVGIALGVLLTVMLLEPLSIGGALYLCMLPIITAVRQGQFPMAIVTTVINSCAGILVIYRRAGESSAWMEGLLGWAFFSGVAWAVGLGVRSVARAAESRVRAEQRSRELELAWELHGSVARNLALIAMQADTLKRTGVAASEDLESIADRARRTSRSLREVTRLLREHSQVPAAEIRLQSAVSHGIEELERLGFQIHTSIESSDPLLPQVDFVAGRILQEALHNVAKHGDKRTPCVVSAEATSGSLDLVISNALPERTSKPDAGLGVHPG